MFFDHKKSVISRFASVKAPSCLYYIAVSIFECVRHNCPALLLTNSNRASNYDLSRCCSHCLSTQPTFTHNAHLKMPPFILHLIRRHWQLLSKWPKRVFSCYSLPLKFILPKFQHRFKTIHVEPRFSSFVYSAHIHHYEECSLTRWHCAEFSNT